MDNHNNMDEITKQDFANNVKLYLEIDEEISKLNIAIKERRVKLKNLTQTIIRNMEHNDIQHINIKNGVLVYKNKEMFKGLNKKNLLNGLNLYFKDKDKAIDASNIVLNNREKINKVSLKLKKF